MLNQLVQPDQDRPTRLIRSAEGRSFSVASEVTAGRLRELLGMRRAKAAKKRRRRK